MVAKRRVHGKNICSAVTNFKITFKKFEKRKKQNCTQKIYVQYHKLNNVTKNK